MGCGSSTSEFTEAERKTPHVKAAVPQNTNQNHPFADYLPDNYPTTNYNATNLQNTNYPTQNNNNNTNIPQNIPEKKQEPEIVPEKKPITYLPGLINFKFEASESKFVMGEKSVQYSGHKTGPPNFFEQDTFGNIAFVSMFYQNACYLGGGYNHQKWNVEMGVIKGSNGKSFEAYKVHSPEEKAKNFLGSRHNIYYKLPNPEKKYKINFTI